MVPFVEPVSRSFLTLANRPASGQWQLPRRVGKGLALDRGMAKKIYGLGLGAALWVSAPGAFAGEPPQPGMALDPQDLPPEARHYERLLRDDPALGGSDDSVENRRHFDAQRLQAGTVVGMAVPQGNLGVFLEVNAFDWLALGAGGGMSIWGPTGGGYARLRPIVWGGVGHNVLSAITLELGYAYMNYGGQPFGGIDLMPCIEECHESVERVSVPSHFGAVSVGLEHSLPFGISLRYGVGYTHLLATPAWRCELGSRPVDCGSDPEPAHDFMTFHFGVGYALL